MSRCILEFFRCTRGNLCMKNDNIQLAQTQFGLSCFFFSARDQKVNVFGPAHIEKSHFKGVFGCIFWQSFMKYGGNKSMKKNSLRPWVLIPEDNRHSTVTRKIPLFSVEPVTIFNTLDSLHNSRLHFYFKIYSLKDISNFRYSNQNIITVLNGWIRRCHGAF
jgi:hypothetical protein